MFDTHARDGQKLYSVFLCKKIINQEEFAQICIQLFFDLRVK